MTVRGTRPERHLAPGSNTGAAPASPGETDASDAPAWGYEPHNGPARWAVLDPAFSVCASGREQSPIELTGARRADLSPVCFDYRRTRVAVENTGHTIQVNPEPGSGIILDGLRYDLQQFHFHHGSEHTVDGVRLPLEMHLVHRNGRRLAGGGRGSCSRRAPANGTLAPVWAHLPPEPAASVVAPGSLDLAALLPTCRTTCRYRGSLTTPPCTEGVAWVILTEPLTLSRPRSTRSRRSIPTTTGPCSGSGSVFSSAADRGVVHSTATTRSPPSRPATAGRPGLLFVVSWSVDTDELRPPAGRRDP